MSAPAPQSTVQLGADAGAGHRGLTLLLAIPAAALLLPLLALPFVGRRRY
jgi:hypothetical protein